MQYRYVLLRSWDARKPVLVWICLNPSTADAESDDPTLVKIQTYARMWGYGSTVMLNLFAFRATDPWYMKRQDDPVGPDNDTHILSECARAETVIGAWGNDGTHLRRSEAVRRLLLLSNIGLHYLRLNQNGEPAHPLYLPLNLKPMPLITKGENDAYLYPTPKTSAL